MAGYEMKNIYESGKNEKVTVCKNPAFMHFGLDKEIEGFIKDSIKSGTPAIVDWAIGKTEDAKEATCNMLGFGMEESHRIIIDYDKNYKYYIVRRYPRSYGELADSP